MIEIKDKSYKQYICVSDFALSSLEAMNDESQTQLSLLYIIIAYIFMKGRAIEETTLSVFLDSINIDLQEPHDYFGNVKKLISETFVNQLYLKKITIALESKTEGVVAYDIGERARYEFRKRDLLNSVATLMNKPMEFFVAQYEEVCDDGDEVEVDSQNDDTEETDETEN